LARQAFGLLRGAVLVVLMRREGEAVKPKIAVTAIQILILLYIF
jgi:hypothetical protein